MARNIALDILKVFLAILVVLIHLSFLSDKVVVLSQLIINGICRLAVPLFLIISGYYFVSVNSKQKLLNWKKRLGILYFIWMVLYSFEWMEVDDLSQSLFAIIFGYFHLWYLIGMLLSGILLYFLKSKSLLVWWLIICFFLGYIIQLFVYKQYIGQNFYNLYLSRNFLFFCFPFMSMGYLLASKKIDNYSPSIWLIMLGLALVVMESYLNFKILGTDKLVSFDLLLTSFIVPPLIFLYVKNKEVIRNTKDIALFSTAIYLVHPLVLDNIVVIDLQTLPLVVQKLIVFIFIFLLSFMLLLLNKKIKYIL